MSWRRWKVGLIVACATGFFSAFITGAVIPEASWKALGFILIASIGKDLLLYLKDHPYDQVSFDTEIIRRAQQTQAQAQQPPTQP